MSELGKTGSGKSSINEHIQIVAEAFASELRALHSKTDWPNWRDSELRLIVSGNSEGAKFKLEWYNPIGSNVEAASLGRLMDEVTHRLGFQDIEAGQIETSLKALPAPEFDPVQEDDPRLPLRHELDNEIPF